MNHHQHQGFHCCFTKSIAVTLFSFEFSANEILDRFVHISKAYCPISSREAGKPTDWIDVLKKEQSPSFLSLESSENEIGERSNDSLNAFLPISSTEVGNSVVLSLFFYKQNPKPFSILSLSGIQSRKSNLANFFNR